MALPLDSSLQGLRESLYLRSDHSPTPSTRTQTAANSFINQAIQRLALDAPYAFHEDIVRFSTDYEYESDSDEDTVEYVTAADGDNSVIDEWTLKRSLGSDVAPNPWPVDRSLDGAFIELTDSRGVVHTNQIRSVWIQTSDATNLPDRQLLTLVRPFISRQDRTTLNLVADTGPFRFRIFHPYVWLPDDLIQIKSMRVMGRGEGRLKVLDQDDVERMALDDYGYTQESGPPRCVYRRGNFQLPTPSTACTISTATEAGLTRKWQGPLPYGSFKFYWTLTWGKRDYDHSAQGRGTIDQTGLAQSFVEYDNENNYEASADIANRVWADNRLREPLFESAPSPVSALATVADPGANNQVDAIVLTFPNVAFQQGFLFTGENSSGAFSRIADAHSGWHIRIYAQRVSTEIGAGYATLDTETSSQNIPTLHALENDDAAYLLAEFRPDALNECRFVVDGGILPDRSRRLRDVHGYQAIAFHPVPDDRYEIEARVVRRPPLLVNDTDVPRLDPACNEAIVLYAASLNYERMKDPAASDRMLRLYKDALGVIGRRYADLRPPAQPDRMMPADPRGRLRPGGFRTR